VNKIEMAKGGKREGAGRKPRDPSAPLRITVCATVSDGEVVAIDAARGSVARSEWIRAAILEKLNAG
jgi:hypothetical protein